MIKIHVRRQRVDHQNRTCVPGSVNYVPDFRKSRLNRGLDLWRSLVIWFPSLSWFFCLIQLNLFFVQRTEKWSEYYFKYFWSINTLKMNSGLKVRFFCPFHHDFVPFMKKIHFFSIKQNKYKYIIHKDKIKFSLN